MSTDRKPVAAAFDRRSRLVIRLCLLGQLLVLSAHSATTGLRQSCFEVTRRAPRELNVSVTMPPDESSGDSELACSRFIAVPAGTIPEVTLVSVDSQAGTTYQAPGTRNQGTPGSTSEGIVFLGDPVQFRDLRLVPLVVRYASAAVRPVSDSFTRMWYTRVNVRVRIPAGQIAPPRVPGGFAELYRVLALNPVEFDATAPEGYLMIVPDGFYNNALALARWKEQKGFHATVKKLSEVGSTQGEIRSYIANAYHTWPVPPEYVLLCGTYDQIPTFIIPQAGVVTDHTYGCIDGDDFFPEVLIGRLPVNSGPMLDYLTEKILRYERTPDMDDTLWFHRATMVATLYDEGATPAVTALECKRWVRNLLLGKGFDEVDTVFDPPYHGSGVAPIDSSVDRGVCFVNGRGWGNTGGWNYPPFRTTDVYGLNNGWKLPVVTSLYCGTGAFNANPCFGEAWLQAGSPEQPKGAVAFFGPSWLATSTRWNNDLDFGIYHGIFDEGISVLGPAQMRGKIELFQNFPMPCDSYILRVYFSTYNVLGDPSLQLWTGSAPKRLSADLPAWAPVGTTHLEPTVTSPDLAPVPGALVSLVQGNSVKVTGLTGPSGIASLAFPPLTGETLFVTITKPGYAPLERSIVPALSGVFVGHSSHSPDSVGPGNTLSLALELKNFGTSQTAAGVQTRLSSDDPSVTVQDTFADYGDIAPGATAARQFSVHVSPSCTSGHRLAFRVRAASGDSVWTSGFDLPVRGGKLVYCRHTGEPLPGQAADVVVTVRNCGTQLLTGLTGTLISTSSAMNVEQAEGTFGSVAAGDSASNAGSAFRVRAQSDLARGRRVGFDLSLQGDGFAQTLHLDVSAGEPDATSPLGPDAHGYYAYDEADVGYEEHPNYNWVEIDPNFGGSGTRLVLGNDETKVLHLPFRFRYYGQEYDRVSVCSNGFLTCDSTLEHSFYNWRLPSAYGPPNIIATFWDDFRPDTLDASGVYYLSDLQNHRFVVEWSRVIHVHGFRHPALAEKQTFEAVLGDPAYFPTRSGDGPIWFQYDTVFNDDSASLDCHNRASVGIANREQTIGLQCSFADSLSAATAPLGPGRAIKFTTDPPDTFNAVEDRREVPAGFGRSLKGPTLVSGAWSLSYCLPAGERGKVRLLDATGRARGLWGVLGTGRAASIPMPALGSGVYFVTLTAGTSGHIIGLKRRVTVLARASAGSRQ